MITICLALLGNKFLQLIKFTLKSSLNMQHVKYLLAIEISYVNMRLLSGYLITYI
jgi:hypothetical protein